MITVSGFFSALRVLCTRSLGPCKQCKEEAALKCHSRQGRKNYRLSNLCEECWNDLGERYMESESYEGEMPTGSDTPPSR